MIETLTVAEATEALRCHGTKISKDTLCQGIEQGKFPFATHIVGKQGGNVFFIYRRMLDDWMKERENI